MEPAAFQSESPLTPHAQVRTGQQLWAHRRTQAGRAALVFGILAILLGITTIEAMAVGLGALACAGAWLYSCSKTDYFHERKFWVSLGKVAAIWIVLELIRSASAM